MSKNHKILKNDLLNIFYVYGKALDLQKKMEYIVQKVLIHYPPPLHTLLLFVTLYIRVVHTIVYI